MTTTGQLSDPRLVAEVADVLAVPRVDPADSFVLHAPLELLARSLLRPHVRPERRDDAREQIERIAREFEAFGRPVPMPEDGVFVSTDAAARQLVAAVDRGELDDVDVAARWLGIHATGRELCGLLADDVVPRLGAAAHAPIFLFQFPRLAPTGELTGELVRGLARELGRAPDWRLRWIDASRGTRGATGAELFTAIAAAPLADEPPQATPFISPLMSAVDERGVAEHVLGDVTGGTAIAARAKAVLRAAAWSMLLEPGDHAPYGWTHCLTLPQAVLGIADSVADPSRALAIASTFVVGFRAALARNPLDPVFPDEDPGISLREALDDSPDMAAAAVWHAAESRRPEIVAELVTRASVQHDAHFVKYTLACLDAAAADPEHDRLFLAAAASLAGWWAQAS